MVPSALARNYERIRLQLDGKVTLDTRILKAYLEHRAAVQKTLLVKTSPPGAAQTATAPRQKRSLVQAHAWQLCPENRSALTRFVEELRLRAYSQSTLRTYRSEFLQLLKTLKKRAVDTLTPDELRRYMAFVLHTEKLTEHTAHSRLNALKFYFEQVLGRAKFFCEIPRPRKPEQLPRVLSAQEVTALVSSVQNLKHRAMLMLAYSAGLRVSEVVGLRTSDVDSERMCIFLKRAKGKKDRLVSLSPVLLVVLRQYARAYGVQKGGYLFEGAQKGTPYSTRSLQEVLQAAKRRAGVQKPGGVHLLRHSFATHLIEKGTDITMIQKLLGHNSLTTTLRYLHTTNKDLLRIISPLDDLKLAGAVFTQ